MNATDPKDRSPSVTGTWSWGDPELGGGRLRVTDDGGGSLFQLECFAGTPMHTSGMLSGRLVLHDGKARYRAEANGGVCELFFRFGGERVLIEQRGCLSACGLDASLSANGVYLRDGGVSHPRDRPPSGEPSTRLS